MHNIDFEILNGLFRSTTNLSAFEDFLASLPTSNAEEEDSDVTDILGNGDLLSALREHMGRIREQQAAQQQQPRMPIGQPGLTEPTPNAGPQFNGDESASGAMTAPLPYKEKPVVLPKKKISLRSLKRPEGARDIYMEAPVGDNEAPEGATVGSVDSGSLFDAAPPEDDRA